MIRRAWIILAFIAVLVAGCGGVSTQQVAAEKAQQQAEVAKLQDQIKQLQGELKAVKEAPQELLKNAVEARNKGAFDEASKLLDDLAAKYPASAEAAQVPAEKERLKQAIAAKRETDRKVYEAAIAKAGDESTPDKAKADLQDYLSNNPGSTYKVDVDKKIAQYDDQIKAAAEEAKKPPVEIVTTKMGENSIGTPTMAITLRNRTKKTIDGFEFSVDLYDNYDRPVYRYRIQSGGNTFGGISQDQLAAGAEDYWTWTMYGFDLATKYKNFQIRSVHFTDGTAWRP